MNIRTLLTERVRNAMTDAGVPSDYSPHVAASKKAGFGDYQANGAMAAAKFLKMNPRQLAQLIVDNLELEGIASKVEVAGPGFINIHLDTTWLAQQFSYISAGKALNVVPKDVRHTVVIDYSSPNLAKEMHVGHLRSTIIGDVLARILEYLGDKVIRQNHVGDWGTQFGMLIAELEYHLVEGESPELALKDLEKFYQQSKNHFDSDTAFADLTRDYVVRLQSGDTAITKLWQNFRAVSMHHCDEIYKSLNVTLTPEHTMGESAYNDSLAPVLLALQEKGLVVEDEGAQVAFLQELSDKNGEPSPVIVRKKDGGYLYATTDLAAIWYRVNTLKADRILYFIDARQSLHMQQVFVLARKAGFASEWTSLEHHPFGTMMGSDGKPFKTRTGGTVKLSDLIDEAIERAGKTVRQKNPSLSESEFTEVARKVGIGAIKYADLSKTRTNDYVFNWESMLSFEGNTGPYLQYAYTRICSIFRKAGVDMDTFSGEFNLREQAEFNLALKTLQFSETIEQVALEAYPHVLCNFLYDLASLFMTFYEACPILKSDVDPETKASRLQLSKGVAKTMQTGLNLLGIEVMSKM